jgi:diadenosine tetraphosphatase ApaH/serine/threonine PP2A family protein phosphatase
MHQQLELLASEVRTLAASTDEASFHRHPTPGAWSAADCVAHLTLTGHLYLPTFDATIAEARAQGRTGEGPWKRTLPGRFAVWSNEPPPRFRLPAPGRMRPRAQVNTTPRDVLVNDFVQLQREFQRRLGDAADLDVGRIRMGSPLAPMVRLTLFDWLGVLTAHERRHVWQARRALDAIA